MADLIDRQVLIEDLRHCGASTATIEAIVYRINLHLDVNAVVLPCKVGDTVYVIWGKEIVEAVVSCIRPFISKNYTEFRGNAICTIEDQFFDDGRLMTHELFIVFGWDAFITREEAEAVLGERRVHNANN